MSKVYSVACSLVVLGLLSPCRPVAAQQALPELTLEELMDLDAGRVFGASERLQPATEAPASVSFITADEIARYGYRTLADILRGVRGLYVTNDRNFSYVGARGFGNPGDYNSRVLLLVNGHRVNDNVFGQAEIGAEFGIDPALFERVEIIRGPASSLYGDSAFFAVVNVIMKSGASLDGVSLTVEEGTLGTRLARATAGRRFASGLDVAVAGTYEQSAGVGRLYFPAFDTSETNNGVADALDGGRVSQLYGQVRFKKVVFTGAYGTRQKTVPTASFGTLFNNQQPREETTDRHILADVDYAATFGASHLTVSGSFDRFSYDGTFPFAGDSAEADLVGSNGVLGTRWTVGARLTRPLRHRHLLTLGAEVIDNVDQDQQFHYENTAETVFATHDSSLQQAAYLQDEIRLKRWLIVNGGLRFDRYEEFQRFTPRAALIALPSVNQSFKYLYGRAFRAPNRFERNTFYFGEGTSPLRPESIDTHELVWEGYTHDWLRTTLSGYWYDARDLITLTVDPSTFLGTTYVNGARVRAKGLEAEAQMRLSARIQGSMSYALQRAEDIQTRVALVNSPKHMAKLRLSVPGPSKRAFVSIEVLSMSARRTFAGNTVKPAATASLTAIVPAGTAFVLTGTIANMFNVQYADPVSELHRQDTVIQNGRTLRVGLTWKIARSASSTGTP